MKAKHVTRPYQIKLMWLHISTRTKKAFPYYVVTMKDFVYRNLLKLAKMISLPTMDETACSFCSKIYDDVTLHIIMYCTALNKCRDQLWDDIVNVLGVVPTVDLWSKCEEDILLIIMGGIGLHC